MHMPPTSASVARVPRVFLPAQVPAGAARPPSQPPHPTHAGFKCNSAVWRALRSVNDRHDAWLEDGKSASGSPKV